MDELKIKLKDLTVDPEFENLIRKQTKDEAEDFKYQMLNHGGAYDPIMVWDNNGEYIILDGHHRYWFLLEHPELKYRVDVAHEVHDRNEAGMWIFRQQKGKKNLKPFELAELALRFEPMLREEAKKRQQQAGGDRKSGEYKESVTQNSAEAKKNRNETRDEMARIAGVSHDTIDKTKKILANGTEEQIAAVRSGEKSIHKTYKEIFPSKPKEEVETEQEFAGIKNSKFSVEKQKEIIGYCREHELEPTKDIAKKFDVSYESVERYRNSIGQKDPSTRALFNRIAEMDAKQAIYSVDEIKPNEYTIDDGIDELTVIRDTFVRNVRWVLDKRRSVIGGNKEIVDLIASFSGDVKNLVKEAKMKGV